jgi:broad specificity phosphatase PhoE
MTSTVWLVRHAHRLDFIQPEWFNTAPFPYDPPLSALGWQQSLELVEQLQNSQIQQIFTSPYLRTIQTAYPIARLLGLSIQVENGLREWLHPEWSLSLPETLPIELLTDVELPIDLTYRSQVTATYPETIEELHNRSGEVAEKVIIQSPNNVLIVAHKHTLSGILQALTGSQSLVQSVEWAPAAVLVLTTNDRAKGNWHIAPGY